MNEIKISVIIPIYNSEKYIPLCLNSLINQQFKGLEIILVNDGSTDNSEKICIEYANQYEEITLINKPNGGLCSARNYGLDIAQGKYILFMDNDDELVSGALNIIWKAIEQLECDILRFNRKRVQIFNNGSIKEDIYGSVGICEKGQYIYMSRKQFFLNYRKVRESGCFSGIWNGAFKRTLFDDVRFDTDVTAGGEDWLVNLDLYHRCQSVGFIPDTLYVYYRRMSHSISTTYQTNRILAVKKAANKERKLILENNVQVDELLHSDVLYISQMVKIMMHPNSGLKRKDKIEILKLASTEPGLDFKNIKIINTNISVFEKGYLLMYKYGMYPLLIKISEIILKIRGNT